VVDLKVCRSVGKACWADRPSMAR